MNRGLAIEMAKRAAAGLSHSDREALALALASAASGEAVEFVRCDRDTLTAWIPDAPQARIEGGVRFTDEDRELIERCGLKEADVARQIASEREARKRNGGPVHLTDAEAERLRRAGYDPELLARTKVCHSPTEFFRLKAEVGA